MIQIYSSSVALLLPWLIDLINFFLVMYIYKEPLYLFLSIFYLLSLFSNCQALSFSLYLFFFLSLILFLSLHSLFSCESKKTVIQFQFSNNDHKQLFGPFDQSLTLKNVRSCLFVNAERKYWKANGNCWVCVVGLQDQVGPKLDHKLKIAKSQTIFCLKWMLDHKNKSSC